MIESGRLKPMPREMGHEFIELAMEALLGAKALWKEY
jgi:hypothetical protein